MLRLQFIRPHQLMQNKSLQKGKKVITEDFFRDIQYNLISY